MFTQPFDDRDGTIWMDGKLVPWREAKIHVLNHSLHYGGAVFEGIRCYNGKIFKLNEHNERLKLSAELLGYELPFSVEEINQACETVIKENNVTNGYLRPLAWRGSEGLKIYVEGIKIHVCVAAWETSVYFSEEVLSHGLRLTTARWKRPSPETAPTASKASGLYMIGSLSKKEAEEKGFNDALMLDWRGYIAEATGANIFLLIDGDIHTPAPDCFLDGITRRTVMGLAEQQGLKIIERHIKPEELAGAQEVFLTGTAYEVIPVGQIDDHRFQIGPVTRGLMQAYKELVRS